VPSVVMVVMVEVPVCHRRLGRRHCYPSYSDCDKRRYEFDLVHGVVPFFVWGYGFRLDGRADQSANESAEERRSNLAPVLRVERAVVVVVMMLRLVVVMSGRLVVVCDLAPRLVLRWSRMMGVAMCRCLRRLGRGSFGDLLCWSGLRRLGRRSLHRRRCLPAFRRIALGCCHCRAAECAADRESQHHLLYCLVHCRVPFGVSRKSILALTHG